eukprot:m.268713 g.268713  ORF g.268713 m.268713 type:complete len:186 (-) comp38375_c0_seq1:37-594(-)
MTTPKLCDADSRNFELQCTQNNADATKSLLAKPVDPNSFVYGWRPMLVEAGARGADKVLDVLLKSGADINATDPLGYTALIRASAGGHALAVEVLVNSGAQIKIQNQFGYTALDCAQKLHHLKVVGILQSHWTIAIHPSLLQQTKYGHKLNFVVWCLQHIESASSLPDEMMWHVLSFLELSELNQ